jgi:energy-coupling factor transport system ATP-binding protein
MKIELKNVTYSYEDARKVLEDFNLTIEDGTFVALLGCNGSGKSTLAKLIMGLLQADSGKIIIDDKELNEETYESMRLNMGIIFQNPDNQFVGVTVKDDIAFGLENRCIEREEMLARINKYIKLVNMEDYLNANPEELSGGQKQRVAIAGALAMETNLLIFDESTSMLDPKGTAEVNEMIKKIKDEHHKTIIVITHNVEEAAIADRVIVLNKGIIVADDTPQEVFKQSKLLKSCGLKTIDSIELLDSLRDKKYKNKKEIEELLWKSTFQK